MDVVQQDFHLIVVIETEEAAIAIITVTQLIIMEIAIEMVIMHKCMHIIQMMIIMVMTIHVVVIFMVCNCGNLIGFTPSMSHLPIYIASLFLFMFANHNHSDL